MVIKVSSMRSFVKVILPILLLVMPLGVEAQFLVERELESLDKMLLSADVYAQEHLLHINSIENMLHSRGVSLEKQYDVNMRLYNAYRAYQFDKAMGAIDRCEKIATELRDKERISEVKIEKATLYTTSGMFFEASSVLDNDIDTLSLNREQLIQYYFSQQRFHSDFSAYTQTESTRRLSRSRVAYYRQQILRLTKPEDEINRSITVSMLCDSERWDEAEPINMQLLSEFDPYSHKYAMYAYMQARICEALNKREEMIVWFSRSAIADIATATKDNASLCSLAQSLPYEQNGIDRAFRYITISLNDALFYNAKLRPWQIASVIPVIENAYHQMRDVEQKRSSELLLVISLLAVALLVICLFVIYLYSRSRAKSREISLKNNQIREYADSLSTINLELEQLNNNLREASAVKEEYIGLFLSMCSDYIEKLTSYQRNVKRKLSSGKVKELQAELSTNELMDTELKNFYEMFDNAFLQLYPNFVEEFNSLLKPQMGIEPKKGERLNTELRIFALIRLGITDSSRIASLLRYSVNTIYNYRARIKNNALCNRDVFEEKIKTIGSMNRH